ncbi:MAG: VTC domain-containing protein [Planctomycetes bacterium]|nr:VTC domain-containing protein [Planctomycetota bacterium]
MAASALTVRDEGALRQDLAERGERKYAFWDRGVGTLRDVLLRAATPITYAGAVSTVRSVYFDDLVLGSCYANLDGLGRRNKFRVRWYDREVPDGDCFFEIKWRHSLATGKHRFRVREGAALAGMPLRQWPTALRRAVPARFDALLEKAQQAVTLVEYRREHYALGDARLTLDYDLRFYPLLGRRRLGLRFAARMPGFALIECKAPLAGHRLEERVLRPLRTRAARFSKYVTACQQLGYAPQI